MLLVQPPQTQRGFTRSGTLLPPLGLATLAASLRLNDVDVKILDAEGQLSSWREISAEIASYRPDVVGITCTSYTVRQAAEVARISKEQSHAITVIGGPHPSIDPVGLIRDFSEVDVTVQNEGEATIVDLVACLEGDRGLRLVDGIAFRSGGEVIVNKPRIQLRNLDDLPLPAWDLLPSRVWKNYWDPRAARFPIATLQTNRGCPHQCIYCSEPKVYGPGVRFKSAARVVDEIQYDQEKFGVREVSIVDSVFTLSPRKVEEICDEIAARRIDISWACNSRVDKIEPSILRKMKRAGCHRIYFGVETGSEEELPLIKKRTTLPQVRRAIRLCKDNAVHCEAGFILGLPGQDMRQIGRTVEFARTLNADSTQFSILLPLPGTAVFKMAEQMGIDLPNYWDAGFNAPRVTLCNLSVQQLLKAQKWAYRSVYFRPEYLLSQLRRIRSIADLRYDVSRLSRFARYMSRKNSPGKDGEDSVGRAATRVGARLEPLIKV